MTVDIVLTLTGGLMGFRLSRHSLSPQPGQQRGATEPLPQKRNIFCLRIARLNTQATIFLTTSCAALACFSGTFELIVEEVLFCFV